MVPEGNVTLQQFPERAVASYGEVEFARLDHKLAMFRALPEEDRELLPEFEQRIEAIAECIDANANLLAIIAKSAQSIHAPSTIPEAKRGMDGKKTNGNETSREDQFTHDEDGIVAKEDSDEELEKQMLSREVRKGFVLLARDWSEVGAKERAICYNPLIEAVENAYEEASRAMHSLPQSKFRVLVPGAGAGRLPWELVRRGFAVEGCEMSFTALLVGNYALNSTNGDDKIKVYPFVHEHSHVRSQAHAVRAVEIPDVNPKDIPHVADFAMRAGNFVNAYEGQDNSWDAVTSCMAFDLGEMVIEHVKRVSQILKPGGVWAFMGPIPCVEGGEVDGVQLSLDEFLGVVRKSGFKINRREEIECLHSVDPESVRTVHLRCPFIVAVKIRPAA